MPFSAFHDLQLYHHRLLSNTVRLGQARKAASDVLSNECQTLLTLNLVLSGLEQASQNQHQDGSQSASAYNSDQPITSDYFHKIIGYFPSTLPY